MDKHSPMVHQTLSSLKLSRIRKTKQKCSQIRQCTTIHEQCSHVKCTLVCMHHHDAMSVRMLAYVTEWQSLNGRARKWALPQRGRVDNTVTNICAGIQHTDLHMHKHSRRILWCVSMRHWLFANSTQVGRLATDSQADSRMLYYCYFQASTNHTCSRTNFLCVRFTEQKEYHIRVCGVCVCVSTWYQHTFESVCLLDV